MCSRDTQPAAGGALKDTCGKECADSEAVTRRPGGTGHESIRPRPKSGRAPGVGPVKKESGQKYGCVVPRQRSEIAVRCPGRKPVKVNKRCREPLRPRRTVGRSES